MAGFDPRSPGSRPLPLPARRAVERLAELVCPPPLGSPDTQQQAIAKVESYLACLPRPTRVGVVAALVALDQGARLHPAARGRRFASLDAARANRYLEALLDSRLRPVGAGANALRSIVALCHYDVPDVRAQLGYEPDPHIARVARRRLERHGDEIRRAEEVTLDGSAPETSSDGHPQGVVTAQSAAGDLELECGAVVIGSGAGGATMAAELADAAIDVVVVEEGGYHPTESFGTDAVRALSTLYRSGGSQTILGRPPITFLEGRCVGGSTVVNGGMCWRTPADVLERWSQAEGIEAIAADDMQRHFERVEARLSVSPQEPESIGRDAKLLRQGAEALGWRLERSLRNQVYCGGCDNCLSGCPTGAKRSMLVTNVPRALAHGARLVAGCRVEAINHADGDAIGVEGRFVGPDGRAGSKLTVRAPVAVAACGAIQTPALLARSGLRPRSGALGRHLTIHPTAALVAIFDQEVRGWEGVHQAYQVSEFIRDGILLTASTLPPASIASYLPLGGAALQELMVDYNRMVVAGCLVEDSGSGRVRTVPGLGSVARYQLPDADIERIRRGLSHCVRLMAAAGARRFILPVEGAPVPVGPDAALRLLDGPISTRALRLVTVHAMGTARMSADPARGVVSGFGELHGASGVFVADASILPGPIGVNPMETICALAVRNAEQLIGHRSRYGI